VLKQIAIMLSALLGAVQPVLAQHAAASRPLPALQRTADNFPADRTFEAGVASLTVKAAFSPSTALSRQELISLLLLMSAPRNAAATRNSIEGTKP
jgi:hypothetical protein